MYKWKIWYADGLIIEGNTQEDWENCPHEGVLSIVEYFGRDPYNAFLGRVTAGHDWYWLYEGEIHGNGDSLDTPGTWLPNPAPTGTVSKSGLYVSDELMETVNQLVMQEIKR